MIKDVILAPNEKMVFQIKAPVWNEINNPLMRSIGKVIRLVAKILGFKRQGFLTLTDKRVIITYEEIVCWCIPTNQIVKTILPHSIKEVGYKMEKTFLCFCPKYVLYYEGVTDTLNIAIPNATEQQIAEYAFRFYETISK